MIFFADCWPVKGIRLFLASDLISYRVFVLGPFLLLRWWSRRYGSVSIQYLFFLLPFVGVQSDNVQASIFFPFLDESGPGLLPPLFSLPFRQESSSFSRWRRRSPVFLAKAWEDSVRLYSFLHAERSRFSPPPPDKVRVFSRLTHFPLYGGGAPLRDIQ